MPLNSLRSFALLLVVLFVTEHCAPVPSTAEQRAAQAAYTADMLKCVYGAKTLSESKACRNSVECRWGTDRCQR